MRLPACQNLSLWERWHGVSRDGEGKPGTKEPLRSDKQALCQSDTIAVSELFGGGLALSGAPRQLPQRGSHWQAGSLPTGRLRPDRAQKGGPCYRGQRLLDNAPCQAVAGLDSGALPFPRHRALLVQHEPDRHARGSPSGRAGGQRLRGLPLHTSFPPRIHSHQSKDRKGASPWS